MTVNANKSVNSRFKLKNQKTAKWNKKNCALLLSMRGQMKYRCLKTQHYVKNIQVTAFFYTINFL